MRAVITITCGEDSQTAVIELADGATALDVLSRALVVMPVVNRSKSSQMIVFDLSRVRGVTVRQVVNFQQRLWKANFWAYRQQPTGSYARHDFRDRMRSLAFYIWRHGR